MLQTPSSRQLEADWATPVDEVTNEEKEVNLEAFIGEYLRNTNGLRDFIINKAKYDDCYLEWCGEQVSHIAARQNHTDAAINSMRSIAKEVKELIELDREYDEARAERLDDRLSKIEKRLGKIALVNMAKTIENALKDCMEGMIDKLMDKVVKRFEDAVEEDRKKTEIRRGKQGEATLEEERERDMSDIKFEPGATFSAEENAKVARILEEREVEEQEFEASRHAPVTPPGEKKQEFARFAPSGQIIIAKRPAIVPAVPDQKKKEAKKPEVKEVPKGLKAGGKKPEVKKPVQQIPGKKSEEMKKEMWVKRAAAPPPSKKQPKQRQQQQQSGQQQKKKGMNGFVKVKRQQKKEEMKPVFLGPNLMEKRRVTFKRDNGLPLSQKKDLDISLEVNRALFEAKVPHFICIQ